MSTFGKITNEVIFFNTPLETKKSIHINVSDSAILLKPSGGKKENGYSLFGYVDYEGEGRKHRYKNKVIITLESNKKNQNPMILDTLKINLIGGIEINGKSNERMGEEFSYGQDPEKDSFFDRLGIFIKESVLEKIIVDVASEADPYRKSQKEIFVEDAIESFYFSNRTVVFFN